MLPRDILTEFCRYKNLKESWLGTTVVKLGARSYSLDDFGENSAHFINPFYRQIRMWLCSV